MPRLPMDYSRTIIYKIQHNEIEELLYVGHTTDFTKRKNKHKSSCKSKQFKLYQTIRDNGGWDCFKMVMVEEFPCVNKLQACKREDDLMREMKANMNSIGAVFNKDKRLEHQKQYREENLDKRAEYDKQYYEENRDKRKQYREANREKRAEQQKQYREANRDKRAEQQKQYREANRDKIAEHQKQYREANRDKRTEQQKQ
jgi:hypothetical protein